MGSFLLNAVIALTAAAVIYGASTLLNRRMFRAARACGNPLHRAEAAAYAAVRQTEVALSALTMLGTGLVFAAVAGWVWDHWLVGVAWIASYLVVNARTGSRWARRRHAELASS